MIELKLLFRNIVCSCDLRTIGRPNHGYSCISHLWSAEKAAIFSDKIANGGCLVYAIIFVADIQAEWA